MIRHRRPEATLKVGGGKDFVFWQDGANLNSAWLQTPVVVALLVGGISRTERAILCLTFDAAASRCL